MGIRDIEFRGKRKDTKSLIMSDSIWQSNGVIKLWDKKDGYVEIVPDTLGEYTGLADKMVRRFSRAILLKEVGIQSLPFFMMKPTYNSEQDLNTV